MKLTWLANSQGRGYFAGDYISTSILPDDDAVPVFAVATPPNGGLLHEAMYTTPEDALPLKGGTILLTDDKVLASRSVALQPHLYPPATATSKATWSSSWSTVAS